MPSRLGRRYRNSLTGTRVNFRSDQRGSAGYSLWQRYWASLVGARLPVLTASLVSSTAAPSRRISRGWLVLGMVWTIGVGSGAVATAVVLDRNMSSSASAPGMQTCPVSDAPTELPNVLANEVTSCAFATNLKQAYLTALSASPAQGTGDPKTMPSIVVVADSPVTGQSYAMTCSRDTHSVTCTGGRNAAVVMY